jgi:hypothetical protein
MHKWLALIPLWALFVCTGAPAQTFDLRNDRVEVTYLQGLWRFYAGDDPAFAKPGFDDSHWSLLRSYQNWVSQGYAGYSGIGWYRFKVIVPGSIPSLSLDLPPINNCYQVFADGKLIGTYGKMPPEPVAYFGGGRSVYRLPEIPHKAGADYTVVIAIRVWAGPTYVKVLGGGPLYGGAAIGSQEEIARLHKQSRDSMHWSLSSDMILAILLTLAALGALALFLLRRAEREYLWFALVMATSAAQMWQNLSYLFTPWPVQLNDQLEAILLGPALALTEIAFYFYLLKGRRTVLFWIAIACTAIAIPFNLFGGLLNLDLPLWFLGQDLLGLPADLYILALLVSRARSNFTDARLLSAPVLLQKGCVLFQQACILTSALGWQQRFSYAITLVEEPFAIQLVPMVNGLFLLTMLAILVLRFARTLSLEERFASEVEGARSIQQFLIPDDLPAIPGLSIHAEYRPAREVGGDFFQVLPDVQDGSALIVVGDVAGKGLEAGMLATLVVGAIRTAAAFTADPALILFTLNNRLDKRGLATCVALRIEADGAATLVNAGHLPPYLNGRELAVEGSLPLGTIAGMEFPVLRFHLYPGDRLWLMTDGIIEAQKPSGELFGFERTAELVAGFISAADLASAAQEFGQSDDITVLTIGRTEPRQEEVSGGAEATMEPARR